MTPEEKENEFREKVYMTALDKYDAEMLEDFIMYWTEPNRTGKKVRWEGQKFFDIKRRLSTWARRSNSFSRAKQIKVNDHETIFDKFNKKYGTAS